MMHLQVHLILIFSLSYQRYEMRALGKSSTLLILSLIVCLSLGSTINIRSLQDATSKVLQKEIYESERGGNYYAYRVYSANRDIVVNLFDSNVHEYEFTYKTNDPNNQLFFRDAYKKFIIVEEMTSDNKTFSYWLLIITRTVT